MTNTFQKIVLSEEKNIVNRNPSIIKINILSNTLKLETYNIVITLTIEYKKCYNIDVVKVGERSIYMWNWFWRAMLKWY